MTSQSKPGPARQASPARAALAFLRRSPGRHRVLAALVLLPAAAATLIGPADTLRSEALALAAIMTALLVLADLAPGRAAAGLPGPDPGRGRAALVLAGPARSPRPREPAPMPGREAHSCLLCGAPSLGQPGPPAVASWESTSWDKDRSIHDILGPGTVLQMAANDDAGKTAQNPVPCDEDHDFWTEEIGPAPCGFPRGHTARPSAAARDPALSRYTGAPAKHALETLAACFALLALAPLLAAIWVALKLAGGGPALSHGRRRNWLDRTVHTTMFAASGSVLPHSAPPLRRTLDVYLRRTGLAGLPLLLAVATGQISFVGPGPERVSETIAERAGAAIVAELARRLGARPGLAGSAAIHAILGDPSLPASHATFVMCDLFYLEHATLLIDLRILARTLASPAARPLP